MPRNYDDEEIDELEGLESEPIEEEAELDDFEDDLGEVIDAASFDEASEDDDDDEDDEDEDGLEIDRDREDWSESLDDMESDYWEDYTRNGPGY